MPASRAVPFLIASLLASIALMPAAVMPARASVPSLDGIWSSLDAGVLAPSARREYAAIYDQQRHRYLIFGGSWWEAPGPLGLLNEIWTLTLSPHPTWSQLQIAGPTPGERHSPQWGYDPVRQRLLIFGGYGCHYPGWPFEYLNDVWELSLDGTPQWRELHPAGTPPAGRLAGAAVYDPLRQRFVGFGGTRGLPVDTWELDLAGVARWSPVATDGARPPGSYGMTSIYDVRRDRMLIFGGSTSDDYFGVHNNVWALSLRGVPKWSQPAPLGTLPSARRSLTSIYDSLRDRMVIFGGWDSSTNDTTAFLGDVWALSLAAELRWTQLVPGGPDPSHRDAMAAVYDPSFDRMVVYGGWSGSYMLGDTQFLTWGQIAQAPALAPSTQANPAMAQLQWGAQNVIGDLAAVYRCEPGTPWSSIATITNDGSGTLAFQDLAVTPGARYGYQLVVPSQQGAVPGGEVWVDIPSVVGVAPAPRVGFTLNRVEPNPLVDRFVVSFALTSADAARLDVMSVTGQRLLSREVGALGAGAHQIELGGARDFRPGMYFVRLTQSGRALTRRVVIGGLPAVGR